MFSDKFVEINLPKPLSWEDIQKEPDVFDLKIMTEIETSCQVLSADLAKMIWEYLPMLRRPDGFRPSLALEWTKENLLRAVHRANLPAIWYSVCNIEWWEQDFIDSQTVLRPKNVVGACLLPSQYIEMRGEIDLKTTLQGIHAFIEDPSPNKSLYLIRQLENIPCFTRHDLLVTSNCWSGLPVSQTYTSPDVKQAPDFVTHTGLQFHAWQRHQMHELKITGQVAFASDHEIDLKCCKEHDCIQQKRWSPRHTLLATIQPSCLEQTFCYQPKNIHFLFSTFRVKQGTTTEQWIAGCHRLDAQHYYQNSSMCCWGVKYTFS